MNNLGGRTVAPRSKANVRRRPGRKGEGSHLGFWAGLSTGSFALAALSMALTTPPRSGVYCSDDCIRYPYTNVAGYVPRDYLWMYPALLAPLAFVVLAVCLHSVAPARRRQLSLTGTCLAMVAAGILVVDYGLQLSVMQPSLLAGESSGLSLLSQYNPHGIFIGLENIGYGLLALAFVPLGIALTKTPLRQSRAAAWILILGGGVILALLAAFTAVYRSELDVRFEVLAILLGYLVLIAAGFLAGNSLSPWTARKARSAPSSDTTAGGEAP